MASLSSAWTYQCGGSVTGIGSRSRLCTTYPLWMLPLGLLVHTPHRLSGLRLVLPSKGHCLRASRAASTQRCPRGALDPTPKIGSLRQPMQ